MNPMPRRSAQTKHPALAAGLERIGEMDRAELAAVPGWDKMSRDQRRFLVALPYYESMTETAAVIGRDRKWYERQRRDNPLFKVAVNYRQDFRIRVAKTFASDLMFKAYLRLDEMLERGAVKDSVQMDAIKTVFRLNGMDNGDAAPPPSQQFIESQNITIFNAPKPKPELAPVVEGQAIDASS
jgi:hypothetical protein